MSDFLQVKGLTGELKVSHKKGPFGLTLSTRELVVQKPHMNYYILFENIMSIVPCESVRLDRKAMAAARASRGEIAYGSISAGSAYYALYAQEVVVHHRGGYIAPDRWSSVCRSTNGSLKSSRDTAE